MNLVIDREVFNFCSNLKIAFDDDIIRFCIEDLEGILTYYDYEQGFLRATVSIDTIENKTFIVVLEGTSATTVDRLISLSDADEVIFLTAGDNLEFLIKNGFQQTEEQKDDGH